MPNEFRIQGTVAPLNRALAPLSSALAPLNRALAPLSRAFAPLNSAGAPLNSAGAPLSFARKTKKGHEMCPQGSSWDAVLCSESHIFPHLLSYFPGQEKAREGPKTLNI